MNKDLVIAVKSVETRKFVGAVTRVEFKNCKDLGGKCGSFFTWSPNPKKALRFHNQLNATEVCVWLCSSDNYVFNKEGYELVIITYDRLIEIYESSKKLEQTKQEVTKVEEKNKKALEIIKEFATFENNTIIIRIPDHEITENGTMFHEENIKKFDFLKEILK